MKYGKPSVQPEDVVVCGNLQAIGRLPKDRWPATIVVFEDSNLEDNQNLLNQFNASGIAVLQYHQSIADLLRSLALHIRLGALNLPTGPSIGRLDRIEDIRRLLLDNNHAIPVLDGNGRFEGIVSKNDLSRQGRCRVILVDHFERPQAVNGLEHAEVLEIIDHHRVGDIQTGNPIRVECRPVGSSCTIVASEYFDHSVEMDRGTATLLLGGIVADTLVLRGPTHNRNRPQNRPQTG